APRTRPEADRRPRRRRPGAPLRRGEDRAARSTRLRVVEGRGGPARAAGETGLAPDSLLGPGRQAAQMTFDGASVLVTGGSRGIGREIALRFAEEGASHVAIGYLRNDRAAEGVAGELRDRGTEPVLLRGNVSSSRIAAEVAALGKLDALVHSAATGVVRPALESEDKHWDWTVN